MIWTPVQACCSLPWRCPSLFSPRPFPSFTSHILGLCSVSPSHDAPALSALPVLPVYLINSFFLKVQLNCPLLQQSPSLLFPASKALESCLSQPPGPPPAFGGVSRGLALHLRTICWVSRRHGREHREMYHGWSRCSLDRRAEGDCLALGVCWAWTRIRQGGNSVRDWRKNVIW